MRRGCIPRVCWCDPMDCVCSAARQVPELCSRLAGDAGSASFIWKVSIWKVSGQRLLPLRWDSRKCWREGSAPKINDWHHKGAWRGCFQQGLMGSVLKLSDLCDVFSGDRPAAPCDDPGQEELHESHTMGAAGDSRRESIPGCESSPVPRHFQTVRVNKAFRSRAISWLLCNSNWLSRPAGLCGSLILVERPGRISNVECEEGARQAHLFRTRGWGRERCPSAKIPRPVF